MEITRYKNNPVLTANDVSFCVNSIFNAGAVKIENEYLLLCRVEMPNGRSSLLTARGADGKSFKPELKPLLTPEQHGPCKEFVEWGVEDPRITPLEGKYYITYTGYSKYKPLVMLAETDNFRDVNILGPITVPSNKDAAIFPEKIGGYYWKIDRPTAEERHDMWISRSPDLLHWGHFRVLQEPESGSWEQDKIGLSSQPVKTDEGWLMLYHGVRGFGISSIYKLGVMLLDPEKPWKVIGKSRYPILSPQLDYERVGDVCNVVFSCGWIFENDGEVKIYYSGADTNICLATTTVDDLLARCRDK